MKILNGPLLPVTPKKDQAGPTSEVGLEILMILVSFLSILLDPAKVDKNDAH